MIILVASNKGGAGKTTTAINLAVAFTVLGKSTVLVDADPQKSSINWEIIREEENVEPKIKVIEKRDNIAAELLILDMDNDIVIVDVAGRNSKELITAAVVADLLISPTQCSQQDLDTLIELQNQINKVKDINPKLKVFCYHTMAATNLARWDERKDIQEYLEEIKDISLLKNFSSYRRCYRTCYSDGKSVIETDNLKAKEEVLDLVEEIEMILK